MYIRYSAGFLMASLIQAGIIIGTQALGISTLGAKLTATQLLTHILVGQVLGYLLLFIMRKFEFANKSNIWVIGISIGVVSWLVLLYINSAIGKVNAPWEEGVSTTISSMIAFIVFGIISAYTIQTYDYDKIKQ